MRKTIKLGVPRNRWAVSGVLLALAVPASAQTPPTDLAELSLEELLKVNVVRSMEHEQDQRSWRFGYRYIRKEFDGYRNNSDDLTFTDVLTQFPVVPEEITQEAHIAEATYGEVDGWTFAFILPYVRQQTDHIRREGAPFTIATSGFGDLAFSASYHVSENQPFGLTLHTGLSLPTGSINEEGDTPRGRDTQVPYTMQLGSGTYDLDAGFAYAGRAGRWHWGSQLTGTVRLGRNEHGYSLSDRLSVSAWVDRWLTDRIQPSIELKADFSGRVDGADPLLDPSLAPVADSDLYGGTRLDLLFGLRFVLSGKTDGARGHTLKIEGGVPIYQSLNGPQPEQDVQLGVAWSWGS